MTTLIRVRAVLSGFNGGPGLSTFYFATGGAVGSPECLEAANRVRAYFNNMASNIPTGQTVTVNPQVDLLDDLSGALQGSIVVAAPAVVTGTSTFARAPISTAVLVRFLTGQVIAGRRLVGRSFLSPVTIEDVAADGSFSSSNAANYAASAALLGTTIVTATVKHRVWHRPNALTGAAGSSSDVTGYALGTKLAVLRSRRD